MKITWIVLLFLKEHVKIINWAVLRLLRKLAKIIDAESLKEVVGEIMKSMLESPLKNDLILHIWFIVLVLVKKLGKDELKNPKIT